ncbi:MAG: hypothetical protein OXD31_17255 [Chloroflexi bacterium]|nr:hypothetical protein [Chloroflexota bacterium]
MAKHRYSSYVETIREIDETVNAVGVEAFMRLEHGTLDHLSKEAFAREAALAKEAERQEPGALRICARADSKQALEDFDNFQREFLSGECE